MFHGKISYKWPFSIAMLVYQRVNHASVSMFDVFFLFFPLLELQILEMSPLSMPEPGRDPTMTRNSWLITANSIDETLAQATDHRSAHHPSSHPISMSFCGAQRAGFSQRQFVEPCEDPSFLEKLHLKSPSEQE